MFLRCLVALCAVSAACAYQAISAAADDNECALYLSGPGRTSAFDYNLNLLRGNFNYDGQHTCITYEAINSAYAEARKRITVAYPKGDWKAEDIASVGELMLDISINLARTYGLTYEEIEKGLPLIDTSRTLIREVCPPVFSNVECRPGKYRRFDGLCNNLAHPNWGATMAPFQRLIGPLYSDGINAPRMAVSGRDLPLSRVVSRTMHPDDGFHDHAGTVMVIAWGQFMDHDYTLTGTPLDPRNRNDPEECCKRPPHLKHPYCNEIPIPDDDYFYRLFGVKCIDFVRGFPSPRPGCRLGSRIQFNTLTGAIDGNTVYGVTEKFSRKLRTGFGGLLRMNPVFEEYGLKDLLPLKLDIPDEGCTRPNKSMYCFEAGEIRVNEQLVLTCMHTLMAREHNRVAKGLAGVNPHWDDETLYQEARRITIAEIQHITYNEFLPILLGKDVMDKFGLLLEKDGYWDGYDSEVNPDVIDAFAAAAYRFGHSLLPTAVERWSKAHKFIASKRLSDLIRRPYDLYRAGVFDEYLMGLMNQVAQAMDDSITQEVTNHLFKKVGARFGMDLVSFNMQRGREFGLPGYMEFRKFCGLPGAHNFQELFGSMPNETIRKYESIFEHPSDVDLWSGGVSERALPGSMLGPTFGCIIATQFSYSRRGDRFWYELPNQPSSFTPEQLTEVRKARLSRVICDNTDIIDTVQVYPMVLPDHELNPRVPCRSGILPSIDFSKWAEHPTRESSHQYFTDATFINDTVSPVECVTTTEPELVVHDINVNNVTNCDNSTVSISDAENMVDTTDKILKYVYEKNSKVTIKEKKSGHTKNSLRKKREIEPTIRSPTDLQRIIVTDEHTQSSREESGEIGDTVPTTKPLLADDERVKTSPQIFPALNKEELADYNYETIHEFNPSTATARPPHRLHDREGYSDRPTVNWRKPVSNNDYDEAIDEIKPVEEEDIDVPEINNSEEKYQTKDIPLSSRRINKQYDVVGHETPNKPTQSDESYVNYNRKPVQSHNNRDSYSNTELDGLDDKKDAGGNVKQQFERIPLDYHHDKHGNVKKPNIKELRKEHRAINIPNLNGETDKKHHNEFDVSNTENEKRHPEYTGNIVPKSQTEDTESRKPYSDDTKTDPRKQSQDDDNTNTDLNENDEDNRENKNNDSAEKDEDNAEHSEDHEHNQDDNNEPRQQHEGNDNKKSRFNYDDLSLHLPEIKLPESVFGTFDDSFFTKPYKYKDDDESSEDEKDESNDYYNYNPSKSNYKQSEEKKRNPTNNDDNNDDSKENDSDEDDLYERFVHQNFHKKGSLAKRTQDIIEDPELESAVKKILHKAEKTAKDAEKSGDPKAGYSWTLEYNRPLV